MKRIQVLIVSFLFAANLFAQDAKTLFVNMPDSLTPLLTAVNRADFVDFLESNMKAEVRNKFGQPSEMTDLSPDYIRIRMTANSNWQMKLLPVNDSTRVVCVVNTACAPVCDSSIRFYTDRWEELTLSDYLHLPTLSDFLIKPDSTQNQAFDHAVVHADMLLIESGLSKTENTMTLTLRTPEYMVKEQAEALKPFLTEPLVYEWGDDRRFVRMGSEF